MRTFAKLVKGAAGILLAAFSIPSFADTCWWDTKNASNGEQAMVSAGQVVHSDAPAACSHMVGQTPYTDPSQTYTYTSVGYVGSGQCQLSATPKAGGSPVTTYSTVNSVQSYTCTPPPPACNDTTVHFMSGTGSTAPTSICLNQCSYTFAPNSVAVGAGGSFAGEYKQTGSNCTTPTAGVTDVGGGTASLNGQSFKKSDETNCVTTNNEKICASQTDAKNCGTVNGEHYCTSDHNCGYVNGTYECGSTIGAGQCITTKSGNGFCVTTASKPLTTPPAPNTGTPGTAATPTATITPNNGNSSTITYFSSSTLGTSTVKPAQGSSTDTSSTPSDPTKTGCGSAGQAPCAYKIDETGTPTGVPSQFGVDPTNRTGDVTTAANTGPFSGLNLPSSSEYSIASGSCTSMTSGFTFNGHSYQYEFPGTGGCQKLELLKTIIGWAIGWATFIYCIRKFINT